MCQTFQNIRDVIHRWQLLTIHNFSKITFCYKDIRFYYVIVSSSSQNLSRYSTDDWYGAFHRIGQFEFGCDGLVFRLIFPRSTAPAASKMSLASKVVKNDYCYFKSVVTHCVAKVREKKLSISLLFSRATWHSGCWGIETKEREREREWVRVRVRVRGREGENESEIQFLLLLLLLSLQAIKQIHQQEKIELGHTTDPKRRRKRKIIQ